MKCVDWCLVREFDIYSEMFFFGDIGGIVEWLLYGLFEWDGVKIFCDSGYFDSVWFYSSEIYYNYFGWGL